MINKYAELHNRYTLLKAANGIYRVKTGYSCITKEAAGAAVGAGVKLLKFLPKIFGFGAETAAKGTAKGVVKNTAKGVAKGTARRAGGRAAGKAIAEEGGGIGSKALGALKWTGQQLGTGLLFSVPGMALSSIGGGGGQAMESAMAHSIPAIKAAPVSNTAMGLRQATNGGYLTRPFSRGSVAGGPHTSGNATTSTYVHRPAQQKYNPLLTSDPSLASLALDASKGGYFMPS